MDMNDRFPGLSISLRRSRSIPYRIACSVGDVGQNSGWWIELSVDSRHNQPESMITWFPLSNHDHMHRRKVLELEGA